MKTVSFFRLSDGVLIGSSYSGPDDHIDANVPDGCGYVDGLHDYRRCRVDLDSMQVIDWIPPAPADNDRERWHFDAEAHLWISTPTIAAQAEAVRAERDRRLAACDWVVMRASEQGTPVPGIWVDYRTALRNVPSQPGFPAAVVWPESP